jgi:hypothetical protein
MTRHSKKTSAAVLAAAALVAWAGTRPVQAQSYYQQSQTSPSQGYYQQSQSQTGKSGAYPSTGGYHPESGRDWYYDYYGVLVTPAPRAGRSEGGGAEQGYGEERGGSSGQMQRLRGEVIRTKRVQTGTTSNLAALLETDEGRRVIVDLGPVKDIRNEGIQIRTGDEIRVRGRFAQVGDYPGPFAD